MIVPPVPPSLREATAGVVRLLDTNGPADLCGISLGALVALSAALDRREAVRRLVLVAGLAHLPLRWRLLQGALAAATRFVPERRLRRSLVAAVPAPYRAQAERELMLTPRDMASLLRESAGFDVSRQLLGLDVATLVLCGERDRFNVPLSRELARLLSNACFAVVPNAGHVANLDNPAAVTLALRAFFAETQTRA